MAISFHKRKRSKRLTGSELTDINGIGEKTAELLIKRFKSVKRVAEANIEELTETVGKAKGKIIFDWFQNESSNTKSI